MRFGWFGLVVLFQLGLCSVVWGEIHVARVIDEDTIELKSDHPAEDGPFVVGERLPVYSQNPIKVIAFARVTRVLQKGRGDSALATVLNHEDDKMVLSGDWVKRVEFAQFDPDYPGREDLILRNRTDVASYYRPVVYQGYVVGQTASVLAKDEWLAGPFFIGYGITNRLQVSSLMVTNLLGVASLSGKYVFWDSTSERLSFEMSESYSYRASGTHAQSYTGYLDIVGNRRNVSSTKISIIQTTIPTTQGIANARLTYSSSIQTGASLTLPNWDRLLFGPSYIFNSSGGGHVGGYLSYLMIGRHLNFELGIQTVNVASLTWASSGYGGTADIFWRF